MIIKRISGTTPSGKTIELIKEITDGTYIFSDEYDAMYIRRRAKDLNIKIPEGTLMTYGEFNIRKLYGIKGLKTVLIDGRFEDVLSDKIILRLRKLGVNKIVYTQQLNTKFY